MQPVGKEKKVIVDLELAKILIKTSLLKCFLMASYSRSHPLGRLATHAKAKALN